jgi:hypothetical protein
MDNRISFLLKEADKQAIVASPGLATQALIRAGKTSYTAGTLYAIILPPN